MKTRFIFISILLFVANISFSQILKPVKWTQSFEQVSDDEFTITFTAKLDPNWAIYSQDLGDDGPVPTSLNFKDGGHYAKVGKPTESKEHRKEGYDELFEMNVIKYKKEAKFTQKIKVTDISKPIEGYVEYMVCDDARCLPPTEHEFSITLKKKIIR